MTGFMFYLQIRRVELEEENKKQGKEPALSDNVTEIIAEEWKNLDDLKKQHFVIPKDVQNLLKKNKLQDNLEALRDTVLKNV